MPLLTPKEAAAHLRVSQKILALLRKAGEIPYVNVGTGLKRESPRYEIEDLDAFIARRKTFAPIGHGRAGRGRIDSNDSMVKFQEALRAFREKRSKRAAR